MTILTRVNFVISMGQPCRSFFAFLKEETWPSGFAQLELLPPPRDGDMFAPGGLGHVSDLTVFD